MFNKFFLKLLNLFITLIDYSNKKKIILFLKKQLNRKSLIILDIGSHKGETIDLFLNNFKVQNIYSFEPNIELFNQLNSNIKYKDKKINILNYGVGSKEGNEKLKIMTDTSSSTFNTINYESKYYKKKRKIISFFSSKKDLLEKEQTIKIITLSNFINNKKIKEIDILKIDTEGYEFNILNGLNYNNFKIIKFIYFEHHYDLMINKGYKFSEINKLLTSNNFIMKYKLKMKFRKSFEYIYENSL